MGALFVRGPDLEKFGEGRGPLRGLNRFFEKANRVSEKILAALLAPTKGLGEAGIERGG